MMKKLTLVLLLSLFACSILAKEQSENSPHNESAPSLTQDRSSELSYTAQNVNASVQERVAALHQLADYPSQNALVAITRGVRAKQPEIRTAAIAAAMPYKLDYRWRLISPLLKDEVEEVRNAAAINLAKEFSILEKSQQSLLISPLEEVKVALLDQNTIEHKLLLANIHRWVGESQQADKYYRELISAEQVAEPEVWLNYADNFRAQGKEEQALEALTQGLTVYPTNANLHYSKALTLVRMSNKNDAAKSMNTAATLANDNSYFWYLNGVLQQPLDIELSIVSFERAYLLSGSPEQLYALCDIYMSTKHERSNDCLAELKQIAPESVIEQLEQKYE